VAMASLVTVRSGRQLYCLWDSMVSLMKCLAASSWFLAAVVSRRWLEQMYCDSLAEMDTKARFAAYRSSVEVGWKMGTLR
jgi:hypothetical protein